MAKDMTQGKPGKIILAFTIPMILGNVFQQLYNIVDSVVVGRFVGSNALAAVGASFPIVFLMVAVAMGLTMGVSVLISQYYGAGRYSDVRRTVYTSTIFMFVVSILIGLVGLAITGPALRLLGTPANIYEDSAAYLGIYFMGIPFMFFYNGGAAVLRAIGDSKTPLYFLIFSTILNIILDLLFVVQFQMGVAGVAWATLIAQGIAGVLSIIYIIMRIKVLKMEPEDKHFDKVILKETLRLGVPSMIQQTLVSFGIMAMQSLVNSFGSDIIAGYTACTKIDSIAMMPMMNIGNAISTFAAQNLGANKPDRVSEGYGITVRSSVILSILISIVIFLFGGNMMHLFVDYNASSLVVDFGVSYLRFISMFYFVGSIFMVTNGILRGAGDMRVFMMISLTNFFVRVATTYVLAGFIDYNAIWWGIPTGWCVATALSVGRYKSGKWKDIKIAGNGNDTPIIDAE